MPNLSICSRKFTFPPFMINAMINIFSQVKPSYTEDYHKSYRELTTIQTKILNITLPYPLK